MSLTLIVLALAAATVTSPSDPAEIVVLGIPLSKLKLDHDECLETRCATIKDVNVSVRYAEGLFKVGRYVESRRVLTASGSRTKAARKQEPVAVSNLYLALANVATHEGDQRIVRNSTFQRAAILHDALPLDAPESLAADMSVADLDNRAGDYPRAAHQYASLAIRAAAADHVRIFAALKLRQATVAHLRRRETEASAFLAELTNATDERLRPYRVASRALAARFAVDRGDKGAIDRLLGELASEGPRTAPTLLWSAAPPVPSNPVAATPGDRVTDTETRSSDVIGLRWADIGYWIKPDGSVETPVLLRGNLGDARVASLSAWITRRRYAPFFNDAGGQYRAERVTLTADYAVPKGSLIARRLLNPRYEFLDITHNNSTHK